VLVVRYLDMKVIIFYVILPGVNAFIQDYNYVIEDSSVTSLTNASEAKKSVEKYVSKDLLPVPKPGATLRPVPVSTTAKQTSFSTTSTLLPTLYDHWNRMTKSNPDDFASETESSK
jgi:hypothetical protein